MNKQRRAEMSDVIDIIDNAVCALQDVADEEQEAFDNLPDGIQSSQRGEDMEAYVSDIEGVIFKLEEVSDDIQEIINR